MEKCHVRMVSSHQVSRRSRVGTLPHQWLIRYLYLPESILFRQKNKQANQEGPILLYKKLENIGYRVVVKLVLLSLLLLLFKTNVFTNNSCQAIKKPHVNIIVVYKFKAAMYLRWIVFCVPFSYFQYGWCHFYVYLSLWFIFDDFKKYFVLLSLKIT